MYRIVQDTAVTLYEKFTMLRQLKFVAETRKRERGLALRGAWGSVLPPPSCLSLSTCAFPLHQGGGERHGDCGARPAPLQ